MKIIDGRKIAQKIRNNLKKKMADSPVKPGLGVILVGNDPASHLYVSLKEKASRDVGINFKKFIFPTNASAQQILKKIAALNKSRAIHGILIQLPLPPHLPTNRIIKSIIPSKDVDGFHPQNIQKILKGEHVIEPVLTKAVWRLIQSALKAENRKTGQCAIIGKSDIFTLPLQKILQKKGLKTDRLRPQDLRNNILKKYNVIIVAVGKPNFLNGQMLKNNSIIIDIGINQLKNGKIVGDVNFPSTLRLKGQITPVPGGVGPVTVAILLENIYLLAKRYADSHQKS